MTTANHILVGTCIALVVKQPVSVVPLAFASHFVLDTLPHCGYEGSGYNEALKHKTTFINEGLGIVGIIVLAFTVNYFVLLTAVAAIVAVSPDFVWLYRYFGFERKGLEPPSSRLTRFHQKIQWGEHWWGIFVEIPFFVIGYVILIKIIM